MIQEFLVKEGDLAPDFTFKDSNNKDLKLSNFLGKQVVLYFIPVILRQVALWKHLNFLKIIINIIRII